MDAAVRAELSLIEAIPTVFPYQLVGVRPVRGVLGDQGDANRPWPRVAIDLSKAQRARWRLRNARPGFHGAGRQTFPPTQALQALLTLMVGWVLVVSVLLSPGILPAERPSHL